MTTAETPGCKRAWSVRPEAGTAGAEAAKPSQGARLQPAGHRLD